MTEAWEVCDVVGTEEEAVLIAGFLRSRGIEATLESLVFHQEPVTFGRLGEVRVRVRSEHAEEARKLLTQRRLRFGLIHGKAGETEPEEMAVDEPEEERA
jgi:hypothetical protein